ncbi:hypothetical protein IFM89_016107 [Coptis chinensis]|uniref:Uncharacterized protein n=1 Tax=Coptis chinensis TaxID=261450 RepID=A0A835HVV8_9MAGN|nr:hypothetical protein IFM89_016107 [Coptis chinensis]
MCLSFGGFSFVSLTREYIIVLICNGKDQNQARNDLEAFLGENSAEFASNLIYVDQPIGTDFSYISDKRDFHHNEGVSNELYDFLQMRMFLLIGNTNLEKQSSSTTIWLILAIPWRMMAILGYSAGVASDTLIKKGHRPITFVRTIMQSIGFIGPGLTLLCLNYVKTPAWAAVLYTAALSFSSFSQAGFLLSMQAAKSHKPGRYRPLPGCHRALTKTATGHCQAAARHRLAITS